MSTNKRVFSSDFLHGFATSAVQTEGGSREGGKGSSVWDRYCREGLIFDKSTCDHAAESYKVWESDIDLLAELGANSYRFSISWPRIIPDGKDSSSSKLLHPQANTIGLWTGSRHGIVNDEGLAFYSRIIDRLLERHIVPVVTIFHWDTPEALDVKYGAWRNPEEISEDFVFYANVLFQAFGDRVKNWITEVRSLIHV
jgi:beta-glucosidase/6-phospho-beta-glucosidase/beta-galactosidase